MKTANLLKGSYLKRSGFENCSAPWGFFWGGLTDFRRVELSGTDSSTRHHNSNGSTPLLYQTVWKPLKSVTFYTCRGPTKPFQSGALSHSDLWVLPRKIWQVSLIILLANLRGSACKSLHFPLSCTVHLHWAFLCLHIVRNLSVNFRNKIKKHHKILLLLFGHYSHWFSECFAS